MSSTRFCPRPAALRHSVDSRIRDRIFVPFFTTKARGTGLGLPTAKRLVEAHRGHISVTCPMSGGTTVTLELPRQ